jgi:DNA repair exonuclease SbcCD ATPase subunit
MIQKQFQEIQVLRHDLTALNQKYILQIEQSDSAELEKQKVESEIEDLSRRLFEQANEMVSHEKRARYVAEKKQRQLEHRLEALAEDLKNEREQLNELRIKFEKEDEEEELVHPLEQRHPHLPKSLDQKWLQLFTDFLKAACSHSLVSLHRLPFLKLCMEMDIEPCLRFGPTTKPKSHHLSTKRVLDTIMYHPCYIEPLSDQQKKRLSHSEIQNKKKRSSPLARRASFAFGFRHDTTSCYGCGSKDVLYRFKLKAEDKEWFFIDKACRDQLVAVCDFYLFIRHAQSGLQKKTTQGLFQECLWLRLCMFWARSGVSL